MEPNVPRPAASNSRQTPLMPADQSQALPTASPVLPTSSRLVIATQATTGMVVRQVHQVQEHHPRAQQPQPLPERPVTGASEQQEHRPDSGDHRSADITPPGGKDWARLPEAVIVQMACWLSFGDQSQCMRVCRHWHQSFPLDRERQSLWLRNTSPTQRRLAYALVAGSESRAYPFLRSCTVEALHRVQRQQGSFWLPGTLLHEMHKQITLARVLTLSSAGNTLIEGSCQTVFSPCGRWLAVVDRYDIFPPRLLSCNPMGRWNIEYEMLIPPSCTLFDTRQQGCFFNGFKSGWVTVWEPDKEDLGHLCVSVVGGVPNTRILMLFLTVGGHYLIGLSRRELTDQEKQKGMSESDCIMVLKRANSQQAQQPWTPSAGFEYIHSQHSLVDMAVSPSRYQMALCIHATNEDYDALGTWNLVSDTQGNSSWHCTHGVALASKVLRILYSPDGNWLLVLLAGGAADIWSLDLKANVLHKKQTVECHVHEGERLTQLPLTVLSRKEVYGKWQPFSGDSCLLALPVSARAVQLWHCKEGRWTAAERLEVPLSQPGILRQASAPDEPHYTLVSDNGQLLVLATLYGLNIWHWQEHSGWQNQLAYEDEAALRDQKGLANRDALLLGACSTHCLTVTGICGELALYGPDNQGGFLRKAYVPVGLPVRRLESSPDGLSIVAQTPSGLITLWQLTVPSPDKTASTAGPLGAMKPFPPVRFRSAHL